MWLCLAGSGRTARQLPATMAGARQDMRTRIPSMVYAHSRTYYSGERERDSPVEINARSGGVVRRRAYREVYDVNIPLIRIRDFMFRARHGNRGSDHAHRVRAKES